MPTALLSVYDKTGLVDLAQRLAEAGWQLLASGGTARAIAGAGLPVTLVEAVTGEPEMLAGRVKTLHPAIHAGLLARAAAADLAELAGRGWGPIDLLVANLYPFEQVAARPGASQEEIIENIDIGGVALLRAAAKNYARVCVLSDPGDYPADLHALSRLDFRQRMAAKAFVCTARYDTAIQAWFDRLAGEPAPLTLHLYPIQTLRYGENPHQQASLYGHSPGDLPLGGTLLQGKGLSYNNLLDLDAAWQAVLAFADPAVVIVKHLSPCGLAAAPSPAAALALAIRSDPTSAFGSVIACNRPIEPDFVAALGDLFVECLIAPGFSEIAREQLAGRKNLRLLQACPPSKLDIYEYRSILGGFLQQTVDQGDPPEAAAWQVVTRRDPSAQEMEALRFAWQACRFVKSNAIVLAAAHNGARYTVGLGGGQPNRLDCVRIAGERAAGRAGGSVLASDAFFPFPDGLELAAGLGVTAVVQPGGSLRDEQVIAAADAAGLAMLFTGVRHFRH